MNPSYLTDKQDQAFVAHIADLFMSAEKKGKTCFTGFLDLRQQALARQVAASVGYQKFQLDSGYPDGERAMLGVFSPYGKEPFPIVPMTMRLRKEDFIGHRDILGALMGLKIKRESIGDILVQDELAVVFFTQAVAPVVYHELTKIGRCGVKLQQGLPDTLPPLHQYSDIYVTVSSLRLDAVVAASAGIAREKAARTIAAQLVFVNDAMIREPSRNLADGDVFSIRGVGKFLFSGVSRETKKGKLQILCRKFV